MGYREVSVVEVREVLRLWLRGKGNRSIAAMAQMDRKTVRRYVRAAQVVGLQREAGEGQIDDVVIGKVIEVVRGFGPGVRGAAWQFCERQREAIREWLDADLRLTKVRELLTRQTGERMPYRTLHRFAVDELGFGRERPTVRVDDAEPGEELQVDFGLLGRLDDERTLKRVRVWGLIFTAVYSRHMFVWPTMSQKIEDVIEGFERAWEFFGGVFGVMIPDNLKAIVLEADACSPRLNERFVEYAQARGFVIDPARRRRPDDKPRVERMVSYVRDSFFSGESFASLDDVRNRAAAWCREFAGTRVHGTTRKRPVEVFEAEEKSHLLPAPEAPYDLPEWHDVTVVRDHHVAVKQALYSVPTAYIGERVRVRVDRSMVKIYHRGQLIKVHARVEAGKRSTDATDYPEHVRIYAGRDVASLRRIAGEAGETIGLYAERLLDSPLPWTRMRQVHRLLRFVKRYGASRVEPACKQALALDVIDVSRIGRMLERALESMQVVEDTSITTPESEPRFARPASDFAVSKPIMKEGVLDA